MDYDSIIEQNKERNKVLDTVFDPISGENHILNTFKLNISKKIGTFNLPIPMKKYPLIIEALKVGSLLNFANKERKHRSRFREVPELLFKEFNSIRLKEDFAFWAAITIKIKDKDSGAEIPFILNKGQLILLKAFEDMRWDNKPIRSVVVKARQWGGSTLTQFYIAWIQKEHTENWNSVIIGDVEGQATIIRGMYNFAARRYPKEFGSMTLKPFEGSVKNRQMIESGAVISIGSMQKPENLRSQDIKASHFSELASYKETKSRKPQDLMQSVKSSIPLLPLTVIVEESTAKGIGNYFHNSWKNAISGKSGYTPVFIPWYLIKRNRIPISVIKRPSQRLPVFHNFIKRMSEYDWFLWRQGATLEGIKWYNIFLNTELEGNTWRMHSENPTTANEAFESTGHRVFSPDIVRKARENVLDPIAKGTLFADSASGKDAFKNITFEKTPEGKLLIWAFPVKDNVKNRYIVSIDIGGASATADWSVIKVLDKFYMMEPYGVPETVARLKIHIDHDLLAWLACQVGEYYNHALVVFENNSLEKKKNTEGNGYLTILNEISEYYDNLYVSKMNRLENVKQGMSIKYGFHTNHASKTLIIDTIKKAFRDGDYIERDDDTMNEADTYEIKPDGTMGSIDGTHDDNLMCTAIGVYVALYDSDKPVVVNPMLVKARRTERIRKNLNRNEATF